MTKITVKTTEEREVKFLRVDAGVRYWEDGEVNGEADDDENPKMPFAVEGRWIPVIELETGRILDWPEGVTASVHYKVCDDGVYTLLDADKNPVKAHDGYVPPIMCPKYNGFGDYIIMDIGPDGVIADWVVDLERFQEDEE